MISLPIARFALATFMAAGIPAILPASNTLRLDPPRVSLAGPGATQQFIVTAIDQAANETDVTATCQFASSAPDTVAVDTETRRLVAKSPGRAKIAASCAGSTLEVPVEVGRHLKDLAASFGGEVVSILTTKGCNSSACHGSPAGQNGFKLSLFGHDVEADHKMIVKEGEGRRLDLAHPEDSLILKKPTFEIAHGGGQLITAESDGYRTLLNWISQGAPLGADGPRLESLEIYPRERILTGAGARQPLAVIGRLSDGATRDMAAEVRYSVGDEGIVAPPQDGVIVSKSRGLTTVTARAMGKVANSQMIVIDTPPAPDYPALETANFIDELVFEKLRRVNIVPFPLSSDRMFVRRVYLDAVGRVPKPEEISNFLADTSAVKRARLVDQLLESDDYVSHWLVKFEDWFRNSQYNSQGRTNGSFKDWIRDMVAEDRPYDVTVRQLLTSTGDTTVHAAANFWHPATDFMMRTFEINKVTPTVSRLFLGVRLECAECHNHPLENLTQDDFYGMAAFFGRLRVKHGYGQYRRIWYNDRRGEVLHPVTKEPVQPRFLNGEAPEIPEGVDRRTVLADWVTDPGNLQFARATVNRVWAEYFGIGIVEPFDDFRSTNRPTNPELLDRLAQYFIDNGYRFSALHRVILNSRAYQLSSHTPDNIGEADPLERALFARYVPRKLPAEVLLDSIVQVTGIHHEFRNYPEGTSPKDVIATNGPDYFLTVFGFPRRDILVERPKSPSLAQSLHLMNSETIRNKVEDKENVLGQLLARGLDDRQIVNDLFERAYAHPPTEPQRQEIERYLAAEHEAGRNRRRALENVVWAILNSKEFQLNQ